MERRLQSFKMAAPCGYYRADCRCSEQCFRKSAENRHSFPTGKYVDLFLLPVAGLCIVFLYQKFGQDDGGTNQVLSTIRSQDDVPLKSAPLIFIATLLTHLTGGSAGREGAAIQLGGSIGNQLGAWLRLDEEDCHVIVMCGMSAAFSAVFGTPMAAAVFSMEVVSVGVMYYAALLPCVISSLVAAKFAAGYGIPSRKLSCFRHSGPHCCYWRKNASCSCRLWNHQHTLLHNAEKYGFFL